MNDIFPDKAFEYLEKNQLISKGYYYIVNRKNYRDAVHVAKWLKENCEKSNSKLEEIVSEIFTTHPTYGYDKIIYKIFRWVKKNITYKKDQDIWDTIEYWQTPEETIEKRTGDCEDGAILTYALARTVGIPANRMLLLCGDVVGGGHCWLGYKPSTDPYNLVFYDWCYWANLSTTDERKRYWIVDKEIQPEGSNYKNMWFAFNENNSFIKFKETYTK